MAICPNCKKETDYLNNVQSGWMTYKMTPDGDYERGGFDTDDSMNEWQCPKCNHVIAQSEGAAIRFLADTAE